MRKFSVLTIIIILLSLVGCNTADESAQIAATTLPVYEFTYRICLGTDLTVTRLVSESVSCLHDYSLQVSQMRKIEGADVVILSGAGLEDFLDDTLHSAKQTIDASAGIELLCTTHVHEHDVHGHEHGHSVDPHIWLSPANAKTMATNIFNGLCVLYPQHQETFMQNLEGLLTDLTELENYGVTTLKQLQHRQIITFHDGFSYFSQAFDLTILEAVEEESGSEASASELIHLTQLVTEHQIPAIFTEKNGSISAASIISAETGIPCFALDMALSGNSYFDAMYYNIDTIWEALQ